jgi:ferric-dicitrate binding protein FerR (iron transport regulator)
MTTPTALPLDDAQDVFAEDVVRYLSGAADVASVARLEVALKANPDARRSFVAFARLHGHLGEIGRRAAAGSLDSARLLAVRPTPAMPSTERRAYSRRVWMPLIASAAGLAAVLWLTIALTLAGVRAAPLVPTISACEGKVRIIRDNNEMKVIPGLRLRVGDRINVGSEGALVVTLQGGRFRLLAGADACIEAADEAHRRLYVGSGKVDVDVSGGGLMAIATPRGTVNISDALVDIQVASSGIAIQVHRGQVGVVRPGGESYDIQAGAYQTLSMTWSPVSNGVLLAIRTERAFLLHAATGLEL